jgi:hypothetical protein
MGIAMFSMQHKSLLRCMHCSSVLCYDGTYQVEECQILLAIALLIDDEAWISACPDTSLRFVSESTFWYFPARMQSGRGMGTSDAH